MNYSSSFMGWLGKVANDFTHENVYSLSMDFANYFKSNSSTGQKLVVGYDSRFFAKEFAEFFSSIMAEKGIKVFLSNKIVPSSVLVVSSLHKKSMGTIVFTGDEHDARFLGIRAYDKNGFSLNEKSIESYKNNKRIKKQQEYNYSIKNTIAKGLVEPFDPTISYESHVLNQVDLKKLTPSSNLLFFNPLFGSGKYIFESVLFKNGLHGYTADNEMYSDFKGIEPVPSLHREQLYEDMLLKSADFGFITSPDCSSFLFLIGPHTLNAQETLYFIAEKFNSKRQNGKILVSKDIELKPSWFSNLNMEIHVCDSNSFNQKMSLDNYLISVDGFGRFFFGNHGAPDALLCAYHLVETFGDKELSPNLLHRKIESVKSILNT